MAKTRREQRFKEKTVLKKSIYEKSAAESKYLETVGEESNESSQATLKNEQPFDTHMKTDINCQIPSLQKLLDQETGFNFKHNGVPQYANEDSKKFEYFVDPQTRIEIQTELDAIKQNQLPIRMEFVGELIDEESAGSDLGVKLDMDKEREY